MIKKACESQKHYDQQIGGEDCQDRRDMHIKVLNGPGIDKEKDSFT